MPKQKIVLTQEEYDKLQQEYSNLINVEAPRIRDALALARSYGDFSENADLDAARDAQARNEARIKEIREQLDNSTIASVAADGTVTIGKTIVVHDDSLDQDIKIRIKGNIGADPLAEVPSASNESPFAKSVIGHRVGDVVTIETEPKYTVKILKIFEEDEEK